MTAQPDRPRGATARVGWWVAASYWAIVASLALYVVAVWGINLLTPTFSIGLSGGAVQWSWVAAKEAPLDSYQTAALFPDLRLGSETVVEWSHTLAPSTVRLWPGRFDYFGKRATTHTAWMPLWPLIVAAVGLRLGIHYGERRLHKRTIAGRCVECGYDLRGNQSGRCPECGAAVVREGDAG